VDVKKKILARALGACCAGAFLLAAVAVAQEQSGDWRLTGADAGQAGWQKGEIDITPENTAANFKLLWKIRLGPPSKSARSFSEPLLAGRLINAQGFKDVVYWSSADTLYAVDSELGAMVWTKAFKSPSRPASGCEVSSLPILMEPPLVINFNARRRRVPGAPRPAEAPAAAPNERRLGVAPGGGYFGLKGIYVLTTDGMLHEQVMTTGADFAPPVKFLPAADASSFGLNFEDKMIYTATDRGCGGVPNGLWAINLASSDYAVASYSSQQVRPLALSGPAITPDGNSIVVTGAGPSDSNSGIYAGSVVSVAKDMKVADWYTPAGGMGSYDSVSPTTFTYKEKQLVVAPGKDGSLALLDAASLGGADHHTPLFETSPLARAGEKHGWDGFATWQDKAGAFWVFASISTGITLDDSAVKLNGPTTHGGVAAFKIAETDGKFALNPVWVSEDMVNPAPPRIANGVVIALSGGNPSTHARLLVLNAATGVELYSSKDEVPTYADLSGVSVGDSHAFFTDHDNVLYSFGFGLEH
jgi:outer membrane protein assembly factor BamB